MSLKIIFILFILLKVLPDCTAQTGTSGSLGFFNLATSSLGKDGSIGKSRLPVCTPQNYSCNTPSSLTYIFTGNGNWDIPENWLNNLIPPSTLPQGYEIIINPAGDGECILNVFQTIAQGATITLLSYKKLRVVKGVLIQQ